MFGFQFCSRLSLTVLLICSIGGRLVAADFNIDDLLGETADSEQAWHKLFELEKCPLPKALESTIIMVNESLANGAAFLSSPAQVSNRYECEFECCQASELNCNVAVYSDEVKHCYLFNCGNPSRCRFDGHAAYTSSLINRAQSVKQEMTTPTTKRTTAQRVPETPAPPSHSLHILDGCRPGVDVCIDPLSHCASNGFCMCEEGYHPKNGVCRKDCHDELEFECTNAGVKFGTPDCIAIYDVCDGTPQCPDGSDEKRCDTAKKPDWLKGFLESVSAGPVNGESKGNDNPAEQSHETLEFIHHNNAGEATPQSHQPNLPSRPVGHTNNIRPNNSPQIIRNGNLQRKNGLHLLPATVPPREAYNSHYGAQPHKPLSYNQPQKLPGNNNAYQQQQQKSALPGNSRNSYYDYDYYNPYDYSAYQPYLNRYKYPRKQQQLPKAAPPQIEQTTPRQDMNSELPSAENMKQRLIQKLSQGIKSSTSASPDLIKTTKSTETKATPAVVKTIKDDTNSTDHEINEAVEREKVDDESHTSNGAIIALSLSLSMTFLLLAYLGCRYRRMKTRLVRRGHKRLKGEEADYLIDGMYL